MDELNNDQNPVNEAGNSWNRNTIDLSHIQRSVDKIRAELHKVIIGQDETLDLLIAAMFCGGHVLIEGVPGIAKTMIAKLLAKTFSVGFNRIQFTPDLMPSDVTGTSVFNPKSAEFMFSPGPIFSNVVLIDEINRSPAKTQASLFEVMEELQVSVDGKTYPMSYPFMVIATQNPIEQEGTYKLPEAQLDRFIFRVIVSYPKLEDEKLILRRFREDFSARVQADVKPVMTAEDVRKCRETIEKIYIKDELLDYIAQIVTATRDHPDLFLGASPRASIAIMKSSKAMAAMAGRDFVTPDDVRYVCESVLNHRIILTPEREMEGVTVLDVIRALIRKIEVPR